jgi:uncharacterized protein
MRWSRYNVWATAGGSRWVYNGVSGAFVGLSGPEYAALDGLVERGEDPPVGEVGETIEQLVRARVVVTDRIDERDDLERRFLLARQGRGSLSLTVVASLGCNFDCPYCFEEKRPSKLKPAVSDAIVDLVRDSLPNLDDLDVTWFGGEPLQATDEILELSDRLLEVCREGDVGYHARIVTNGWYLTAEVARDLVARGVEVAQVTIDGPERIHDQMRPHINGGGTFRRIVDNIVAAADVIDVNVRVNVTKANLACFEELLIALEVEGLRDKVKIAATPVIDAPAADAPIAGFDGGVLTKVEFASVELELMELSRRYGFGNPGLPSPRNLSCAVITPTTMAIGPDGELWKCWDEIGNDAAVFGTIFDYERPSESLVRWHSFSPFADEQCRECVALPVCMGGCPFFHFEHPLREAQCGTFRFNHQARVARAARLAAGEPVPGDGLSLDRFDAAPPTVGSITPVALGATRRRLVTVAG